MFGVNTRVVWITVVARLHHHHYFFERAFPGSLTDPIDGALDLSRASLYSGERVGHRKSQIVVTVYAYYGAIAQRPRNPSDQSAIFIRRGIAYRVRNVN